jgi:hypothetical protein
MIDVTLQEGSRIKAKVVDSSYNPGASITFKLRERLTFISICKRRRAGTNRPGRGRRPYGLGARHAIDFVWNTRVVGFDRCQCP